MRGSAPPWRGANPALNALTDARFLIALAILVMNDHWWKAAYGNWLTGKLSDVAGLVVLPIVATTGLRLAGFRPRPAQVLGIAGLWFAAIKTSTAAAGLTVSLAERLTGSAHSIVVDPTDLVGLAALAIAACVLHAPRPLVSARAVRSIAFAVGLLAVMATSNDGYVPPNDLAVETATGDIRAFGATSYGEAEGADDAAAASRRFTGIGDKVLSLCDPEEPWRCFSADADRVIEEVDGDSNTVWSRDATSPWKGNLSSGNGAVAASSYVSDMVFDRRGVLHVVGLDGQRALRSPAGDWTPSFASFRPIAVPSALAAIITLLSVSAVAMRRQSAGLFLVAPAALTSYFVWASAINSEFPDNLVALAVAVAFGSAAAILLVFLGYGVRARWLFVVPLVLGLMYLETGLAWALLPFLGVALLATCVAALFTYGPQDRAAMAIAATCVAAVATIVPYVAWRLFIDVTYKWTYLWMPIMAAAMVFVDRLGLEKLPARPKPGTSEVSLSED